MSNKKAYIFGAASLGFNILILYFDTVPYLAPKIKNFLTKDQLMAINGDDDSDNQERILKSAIAMLKSRKSITIWDEENGFTRELAKKIKKIKNREKSRDRLNHYPRAFLYYGLTKYTISKNRKSDLNEVKNEFDSFIDFNEKIHRIDQVPFGLAALNLYEYYNDDKYLVFAKKIFDFIISQMDENDLISYRAGQVIAFPDTLGLIVPFLLRYDQYTDTDAISLAKKQMDYFIEFGVNPKTYIPVHGVNRNNNVQVGSTNWGRGIGWYLMALSHYTKDTMEYKTEYDGIIETISKLKNEKGLWGQFPGSKDRFDASTTTMFLYSMILNNLESFKSHQILKIFDGFISKEGLILETSGDTYTLNSYSNRFGNSELSQGLLLLILSEVG